MNLTDFAENHNTDFETMFRHLNKEIGLTRDFKTTAGGLLVDYELPKNPTTFIYDGKNYIISVKKLKSDVFLFVNDIIDIVED